MIERRKLMIALGASAIAAPLAVQAQRSAKPARIGILSGGSPEATGFLFDVLRQRLLELGYVEGKDVVYEFRWARGKIERLPDLAQELVTLHPDVIFTATENTARAAQQATQSIAIVYILASDPVERGFAKSLAHPSGNVTGLSNPMAVDAGPKRLELLLAVVPKINRVVVLLHPAEPSLEWVRKLQTVAQTVGVDVLTMEVLSPAEIEAAFARMAREHTGGVMPLGYLWSFLHRRQVTELALRHRMPTIFGSREAVGAGGLMSYGVNFADEFRRGAMYVDKILKGAKPADLPFEQATRLELVINLKTAKALGLTIPQSVLLQADEVIE